MSFCLFWGRWYMYDTYGMRRESDFLMVMSPRSNKKEVIDDQL
jgi:hypothetical protein